MENNLAKENEYKLAMSMLGGKNSIENMKQGYSLLENLADEGYCFAQYVLGVLYYDETKIILWNFSNDRFEKDTDKAIYYLEKAKNNNDPKVSNMAAKMLENIK